MTIEGIAIDPAISGAFSKRSVPPSVTYERVIRWPKPEIFHVPFADENVGVVISEAKDRNLSSRLLFDYIQIHRSGETVLQWFDFPNDSILISPKVPAERISALCSRLGLKCDAPEK